MMLGIAALAELLFSYDSTSQVCQSFIYPKIPPALSNPDRDSWRGEGAAGGLV